MMDNQSGRFGLSRTTRQQINAVGLVPRGEGVFLGWR